MNKKEIWRTKSIKEIKKYIRKDIKLLNTFSGLFNSICDLFKIIYKKQS